MKYSKVFILFLSFFCSLSLCAMNGRRVSNDEVSIRLNEDRYVEAQERRENKIFIDNERWKDVKDLREKYKTRKESGASQEELNKIAREMESKLAVINGGWGDIIARGLVGPAGEKRLNDIKIGNDFSKGILMGGLLRGTMSVEKAVGDNIDRYVKGLFDMTLGKLEQFLVFLKRLIFNSNREPFNVAQVRSWKNLITSDFRELDSMIKTSSKYSSSGRDDILREYGAGQEKEEHQLNLWLDFIQDQVLTYEDLADEIEYRLGFYDKKERGFGIVNCAKRLKNKLLKAKSWLLSVRSLKDFANIPEVRSIIPAMKRSLENYFDALINQIKPLGGKSGKTSRFSSGKSGWGSDSYDDHSSIPHSM